MPVSDIKRLFWYVRTLLWSLVRSWNEVANLLPGSDSYSKSVTSWSINATRRACKLPSIHLNLSPQVSCVWHAIHFISQLPIHHHHFSCSASNPVSFVVRNQTVVKRRTQLDAESLGKYPTNRYIVLLIYSGINQFENHGAVYFSEVSPWPRIMRLHRLYFWPFFNLRSSGKANIVALLFKANFKRFIQMTCFDMSFVLPMYLSLWHWNDGLFWIECFDCMR